MIKVDQELKLIYVQAMEILEKNKGELLKYCDTTSLKKMMRPIIEVKVNRRLNLDRRGCCKYRASGCIIEISEYMLRLPEKEVLTTMVHELLHTFTDARGHKGNWLWRANILKDKTGLDISRTRSIEGDWEARRETNLANMGRRVQVNDSAPVQLQMNKTTQVFRCMNCGQTVKRTSNCKFTRNYKDYRCGACHGEFEKVEEL